MTIEIASPLLRSRANRRRSSASAKPAVNAIASGAARISAGLIDKAPRPASEPTTSVETPLAIAMAA
jgi:hypothetical protein